MGQDPINNQKEGEKKMTTNYTELTYEDYMMICELLDTDLTVEEIAEQVGTTAEVVRAIDRNENE